MTPVATVFMYLGIALAAYVLIRVYCFLDARREKRREAFAKVAFVLQEYGLVRLPKMLLAYSTGNYSDFFKQVAKLADLLDDGSDVVVKEFDQVFARVMDKKLTTPEGKAFIRARVDESEEKEKKADVAQAATSVL